MTVVTGYVEAIDTRSLAFVGPIVALETLGDDRIVAVTEYGYRLSLLGRFDHTSESALARSPVTGIEIELFSGEPIMSVSDFRVPFGDLEDLPQLLRGKDIITGGSGSGTNELYGFAGDDRITWGPGPDILDGGPGIDELRGGLGTDYYYVDRSEDLIEDPDGGQAFLRGKLYTLPEPLTALSVAPGGKAATLIGNGLDNFLYGRSGKDRLEGLAGNDHLEGGSGADTLVGGPGDDLSIVRDGKDRVLELAGEGTDTVRASTSWTMAAEVERLEASGRKLKLVGNDLDNEILIGGIAKSIDGRGGDDRISLGEGKIPILGGTGGDRFTWRGLDGQLDTYATSRRARATCSISTPSYRPVLRPTRWHSSASPRRRAAPSSKSMSTARGVRSDGRRSSS
jgi:hypothetical protein